VTDADAGAAGGLVTVRVLGVPMPVYLRASEHGDELMREFALIAASADEGEDVGVPVRLLALVAELRAQFSGFTLRPESELAEAAARGDATIDVEYLLPPQAGPAVTHLGELLDEADDFCRAGDLLTLATPPEAVAFRRWFLEEFVRQADGLPPIPWSDWKQ
jgi:hypothetical protein